MKKSNGSDTVTSHLRRKFLMAAATIGATPAWARPHTKHSISGWKERRDLFPQGVASGDPQSDSVVLWTRFASEDESTLLSLEVSEDPKFERVLVTTSVVARRSADWTVRVLLGGLKPAREYWYRFFDSSGNGSRIGRTRTSPTNNDPRTVRFAFVSCQDITQGAQNAYRRMIWEDERAAVSDQLGFVLHLGDFIYEVVWYPEDKPEGMYDRRIRDIVRYPHGKKFATSMCRPI
jgi:alkaline phosphatase D